MIHKTRPIFSTQFHPEAKGGPLDSAYLFDIYIDSVRKYKASQGVFQAGRDEQPSRLLADLLGNERVGVRASLYLNEAAQTAPAVAAA
jgi:carbamoyl-phosphate synthase small subunit